MGFRGREHKAPSSQKEVAFYDLTIYWGGSNSMFEGGVF